MIMDVNSKVASLVLRSEEIDKQMKKLYLIKHVLVVTFVLLSLVAAFLIINPEKLNIFYLGEKDIRSWPVITIYPIILAYLSMPLIGFIFNRSEIALKKYESEKLKYDIDTLVLETTKDEKNAERSYRYNNIILQKYYGLNLTNNLWMLIIGSACVFSGFLVIIMIIYLIVFSSISIESQTVIALLGAIGTFLATYVGRVFLKMHGAASGHLGNFHSRLVKTDQILLSSVVASRIKDEQLREKTLAELAIKVSDHNYRSEQYSVNEV
ncbi:hypothetical protein HA399_09385 [Cobetia sp. UIB-001]|uniref:hypothetical protein n=1 Tax=Cobetia sp. UIB-001 TaxID=2717697 RepID=UPI00384C0CE2